MTKDGATGIVGSALRNSFFSGFQREVLVIGRVVQKQPPKHFRFNYHYSTAFFSYQPIVGINGWIGKQLDVAGLAMQEHAVPCFDFLS